MEYGWILINRILLAVLFMFNITISVRSRYKRSMNSILLLVSTNIYFWIFWTHDSVWYFIIIIESLGFIRNLPPLASAYFATTSSRPCTQRMTNSVRTRIETYVYIVRTRNISRSFEPDLSQKQNTDEIKYYATIYVFFTTCASLFRLLRLRRRHSPSETFVHAPR